MLFRSVGGENCWHHSTKKERLNSRARVGPEACIAKTRSGSACRQRRSEDTQSCAVHRLTEGPFGTPGSIPGRTCVDCQHPRLIGVATCFSHSTDAEFLAAHAAAGVLRCCSQTTRGRRCQTLPNTAVGLCERHLTQGDEARLRATGLIRQANGEATRGAGLRRIVLLSPRARMYKLSAGLGLVGVLASTTGHPVIGIVGIGAAISLIATRFS